MIIKDIAEYEDTDSKLSKDTIFKLHKEIERLNKRNKEIYEGFMATTKELTEYAEENERLNNIINELEEYIKPFLYMLNGILDKDVYEQCQLDDFTMIMDKLQELKGSKDNE